MKAREPARGARQLSRRHWPSSAGTSRDAQCRCGGLWTGGRAPDDPTEVRYSSTGARRPVRLYFSSCAISNARRARSPLSIVAHAVAGHTDVACTGNSNRGHPASAGVPGPLTRASSRVDNAGAGVRAPAGTAGTSPRQRSSPSTFIKPQAAQIRQHRALPDQAGLCKNYPAPRNGTLCKRTQRTRYKYNQRSDRAHTRTPAHVRSVPRTGHCTAA